jgi:hypothetical protein
MVNFSSGRGFRLMPAPPMLLALLEIDLAPDNFDEQEGEDENEDSGESATDAITASLFSLFLATEIYFSTTTSIHCISFARS